MGKNKNHNYVDKADSIWKLFEKTGNISFYLLYKRITDNGSGI